MKRPLMLFCIGIMLICVFYNHICNIQSSPPQLPQEAVILEGRVTAWESRYENNILYLSDIFFYDNSVNEIATDNSIGIQCYVESMQEIKLGQTVAVQGFLALPQAATNEGGFDVAKYYRSKGYDYVLYDAKILEAGNQYDYLLQLLYQIRQYAVKQLHTYLDIDDAGIMSAMLVGDKSSIDSDTKELYRTIGIYHILAISGLHISMIGGILYKTLKGLRIKPFPAVCVSCTIILLYGIMIGMPPSAFRAIVMYGFGLVAPILQRSHDRLTSLAAAGACLLIWEPLLAFDAGVQLSFLAVLGIVALYPTFLDLHRHHMRFADGVWVSFAITYMTLPVIMNAYYEIPLYSLIANTCVLPFVPLLIGSGFVIVICGDLISIVARVAAGLIQCILFFYEKVLVILSKLPGNSYVTGAPEEYKIVIFYIVLVCLIFFILHTKRKLLIQSLKSENAYAEGRQKEYVTEQKIIRKKMFRVRVIQVAVMFLLLVFLLMPERFDCRITFLDVGQGDGVCVEADGKVYLIDCGSTSEEGVGTYTLMPFLEYRGIMKVDGWFLTHADMDHVSAFRELCLDDDMGGIHVENLYIPAGLEDTFEELILMAENHDINVILLECGDNIADKTLEWTVLSPDSDIFYTDENAASLVLYMEYGQFDGLFMGDAGTVAENSIMEDGFEKITLLKVAHHGSGIDTNSEAFLREMSPEIAVISCGYHNSYGHPHEEVTERLTSNGCRIYRTDLEGQISLMIQGREISIRLL